MITKTSKEDLISKAHAVAIQYKPRVETNGLSLPETVLAINLLYDLSLYARELEHKAKKWDAEQANKPRTHY